MGGRVTPFFQLRHAKRALGCAALCAVMAALLVSCGGQTYPPEQGSGTGQNNGESGAGSGGGAAALAITGAYQGTLYNSDFVSFLTPAPELAWYGLYYLQTNGNVSIYPDIYRGTFSNVTSDSASIANLSAFQFSSHLVSGNLSHLSIGTAVISGASPANYQVALNGISLTNSQSNPSFSATAIPTYAALPGNWTGSLTDNEVSGSAGVSLTFDSEGVMSNSVSYANCPLALKLTSASFSPTPYYTARLEIAKTTGCRRSELNSVQATVLTGIGFIHDSPVNGRSKRLEIILTDSAGSGISFRGDQ